MKKGLIALLAIGGIGVVAYYFYNKNKKAKAVAAPVDKDGFLSGTPSTATPGILPGEAGTPAAIADNGNTGIVPPPVNTTPSSPVPVTDKPVDYSDPSTFAGAVFYEHPYRGYTTPMQDRDHGWAIKLPPGLYASDLILKKFGIVNDQVSSVDMDPGIQIKMYQDANFKGKVVEASGYIDYLKNNGFDNAMSSVEVIDTRNSSMSFAGTKIK